MLEDKNIISIQAHKKKKAALRGFVEWKRLFLSFSNFDENTRWSELPDHIILFLSDESDESRLTVYELIMGTLDLGKGHNFEKLPSKTLMSIMDVYFVIMDQIHFECMRRIGWIEADGWSAKSIIEQVQDACEIKSSFLLQHPRMTLKHPAYAKALKSNEFDYGRFVRSHIPDAVKTLKIVMKSKAENRKDFLQKEIEKPE